MSEEWSVNPVIMHSQFNAQARIKELEKKLEEANRLLRKAKFYVFYPTISSTELSDSIEAFLKSAQDLGQEIPEPEN